MLIKQEPIRVLTVEERQCIDNFIESLQQTCSDLTDTYRILGQARVLNQQGQLPVNLTDNEIEKHHFQILDQLVAISAPIAFHDKKLEDGVYSLAEVERIEQALKENPLLLKLHGINPEAAFAQLDLSKQVHEKIKLHKFSDEVKNSRQEELNAANREKWRTWLIQYHKVLSN